MTSHQFVIFSISSSKVPKSCLNHADLPVLRQRQVYLRGQVLQSTCERRVSEKFQFKVFQNSFLIFSRPFLISLPAKSSKSPPRAPLPASNGSSPASPPSRERSSCPITSRTRVSRKYERNGTRQGHRTLNTWPSRSSTRPGLPLKR